ncbi:hypothetical protein KQI72_09910 [Eubacterium sp. MSJ-21]|nr:hypothetical protein [Eubacterium sp. MSJ-21]
MRFYTKKIFFLVTIISVCLLMCMNVHAESEEFLGKGTGKEPYLIQSRDDLYHFRDLVNKGEKFQGIYFRQTCDIDLESENWEPIGNTSDEESFWGIYDGNGYSISNLYITEQGYAGFFGSLGGKVVNLKIISGHIEGTIAGAIAGQAVGDNAVIANCINYASICGNSAAGIAGEFYQGVIANCINKGIISGETSYGIVAIDNDVKIYSSYSVNYELVPKGIVAAKSAVVTTEYLSTERFAVKNSITAAIAKWLFLGTDDVDLLEWENNGNLTYKQTGIITQFVYMLNFFLLPLLLCCVLGGLLYKYKKNKKNIYRHNKYFINAIFIISIIISYFCDVFVIVKGITVLHFGNVLFLILINLCSILFGKIIIENTSFSKIKIPISLLLVIAFVIGVELLQFNNVPRYDANIYYGSLVRATRLFNLDFLSFLGAFNCWKWAQGVALFVAPLEAILPGRVIGVYIANLVITVITICILYWLIKKVYNRVTSFQASMVSLLFAFSPYIVGLFSYIDMDWNVAFFAVWFLAAVIRENDFLISFTGFLLSFTKITGFAFYVFFLFSYMIVDVYTNKNKNSFLKQLTKWWSWKKVFLWALPVFCFLILFKYGDYFTSQSFYGTFVSTAMINLMDKNQIINTLLQSFVFGFRWLLMLLIIIGIVWTKKRKSDSSNNMIFINSLYISSLLVLLLLMLYNSDANCPRYTTLFSLIFALLIPLFIDLIPNRKLKNLSVLSLAILMMYQTFWTIDLSIVLYADSINTGQKEIYKLAYKSDKRVGMNIVSGANGQYPIIGDVYAYNLEYSFYDDLLNRALNTMDFSKTKNVFILDIADYEINISGRNYGGADCYKIYWDNKNKKRIFNSQDKEMLRVKTLYSDFILLEGEQYLDADNRFYLVVPARVNNIEVINKIQESGYIVDKLGEIVNLYGKIDVYYFEK